MASNSNGTAGGVILAWRWDSGKVATGMNQSNGHQSKSRVEVPKGSGFLCKGCNAECEARKEGRRRRSPRNLRMNQPPVAGAGASEPNWLPGSRWGRGREAGWGRGDTAGVGRLVEVEPSELGITGPAASLLGLRGPLRDSPEAPQTVRFLSIRYRFVLTYFYIFSITILQIYGPPEILQNYTSAAVHHSGRDITPWATAVGAASSGPLAWDRHSVVTHDVRNMALWATTLCPSVVGHGGNMPASVVGPSARV
jgi:hypothetical protein